MDLYPILLTIYFLIFLGLAIKNLKWAIYVIVFGLPSYLIRFSVGFLPLTLLEGMVLIVFAVWAGKSWKYLNIEKLKQSINYQVLSIKYLVLLIAIFLLAASLAALVGPELRAAAGIWRAYFIEPILFLVVFLRVIKREEVKYIFYAFGFSVLVLSLVAIYQKISGNLIPLDFWAAKATRRVTGVFPYPNALGLYLAPVIVLLTGWLAERIGHYKLGIKGVLVNSCWLVVIGLGLLASYATKSKGALMGILAGFIFYALFYKGKRRYFLAVVVVALVVGGWAINTGSLELRGVGTVEGGDSISTRLEMWREGLAMLKERPIFGAGLAGYQQAVQPYHRQEYIEIYLYPHNVILNFWSEVGILGLAAFLGLIVWYYRVGYKNRNELSVILMGAMTVMLVHGLVDVPYFKNDLALLWWILVGGMIINFRESDKNKV